MQSPAMQFLTEHATLHENAFVQHICFVQDKDLLRIENQDLHDQIR